ncbi:hypothetical protein ZWY2020_025702 [Hordeum vulgare]|nr:hypothetical protein ZWY2020_025702 [Hordeum vulgare]
MVPEPVPEGSVVSEHAQGKLLAAPRPATKRETGTHPHGGNGGGRKKACITSSGSVRRRAIPTTVRAPCALGAEAEAGISGTSDALWGGTIVLEEREHAAWR